MSTSSNPARPEPGLPPSQWPGGDHGFAAAQALAGLLPEGVLLVRDGLVVFANEAAATLMGAPASHWLGQPVEALIGTGEVPTGGDGGRCADGTLATLSGPPRDVSVVMAPIAGPDAATVYLVRTRQAAPSQSPLGEHDELAALSRRLLEMQDHERQTVARELYDEIGQCLSAVRLQFAQLRRKTAEPGLLAPIESAEQMADRALASIRRLARLLYPPQLETLGLGPALRWHLALQASNSGVAIEFEHEPTPDEAPLQVAIAAFRIVEEAVSDAIRHASAGRIVVRLAQQPDALQLQIADDGQGFSGRRGDEGTPIARIPSVLAMKERARALGGDCQVRSSATGTTIKVRLPWQ